MADRHRRLPRLGPHVDRRDLTGSVATERMADDILGRRREGCFGPLDLTELGWTFAQAERHGAAAEALAAVRLRRILNPIAEPHTTEVVATSRSPDTVDPLERIGRGLGNPHLVSFLFGVAFYGGLALCLMRVDG